MCDQYELYHNNSLEENATEVYSWNPDEVRKLFSDTCCATPFILRKHRAGLEVEYFIRKSNNQYILDQQQQIGLNNKISN